MTLEQEIQQKQFASDRQKMMINIIYTAGYINQMMREQLKPYGISPPQYNILRILRGQHPKPATVKLLTNRMLDKMSNASRLVETLRKKELIIRKICPNDRRRVEIKITKLGLQILSKIDAEHGNFDHNFDHISDQEARTLNNILDKTRKST